MHVKFALSGSSAVKRFPRPFENLTRDAEVAEWRDVGHQKAQKEKKREGEVQIKSTIKSMMEMRWGDVSDGAVVPNEV